MYLLTLSISLFIILLAGSGVSDGENFKKFAEECSRRDRKCIAAEPSVGCKAAKEFLELKDSNCLKKANCMAVVKLSNKPLDAHTHKYVVEMVLDPSKGRNVRYVAFGISGKKNMSPNMIVFECALDDKNAVHHFVSWVTNMNAKPVRFIDEEISMINKMASEMGAYKRCAFELPGVIKIKGKKQVYDLSGKEYIISFAGGPIKMNKDDPYPELVKHLNVLPETLISYNFHNNEEKMVINAKQVHAIMMTIVYMCLMPLGALVARFFRETWSERRLLKFTKRIWFPIHVILMYVALLLALIGYILIATDIGQMWPPSSGNTKDDKRIFYHALVGTISLILFLLQTTLPWLVYMMDVTKARIYYLVHVFVGHLTYVLGILNIATASYWVSNDQPCSGTFISCLWIAFHICFYIVFTTLMILSDPELEMTGDNFRALKFPMKIRTMDDAPGAQLRSSIFFLMVVVSLALTISMCVIIVVGERPCTLAN